MRLDSAGQEGVLKTRRERSIDLHVLLLLLWGSQEPLRQPSRFMPVADHDMI